MHESFRQHVESLHPSYENLVQCGPFTFAQLPKNLPLAGVYLFSEGGKPMYVGRTNNIRQRIQQHCRPGSGHNSAPFAFRLAREERNVLKATYTAIGSRESLLRETNFADAFLAAKARVRSMQVRAVEESNPLRQALLEMYVAIVLEAPYNDFDNH